MSTQRMNEAIDALMRDDALIARVLRDGSDALTTFALEPDELTQLVEAVRADGGAAPYAHVRQLARFEPLFAAASASVTKIG
jgi:hypothetical protein